MIGVSWASITICGKTVRKRWLVGSRAGLRRFYDLLLAYIADPRNSKLSEHEHYGPFGSLEVMTWTSAGMDGHAIFGTLDDLGRLAKLVEQKLAVAVPGDQVRIAEDYAPNCGYALILDVREDGYDPPQAEAELYGATG